MSKVAVYAAHESGRLRYLDDTPDRDLSNGDTFRNGMPILVMDYRWQVMIDTGDGGIFKVMKLNTVGTVPTCLLLNVCLH